jgi:hypothetical protein
VAVATVEDDQVGAMAVAGYRWPLGERFALLAEGRYNAVSDFDGPSLAVGLSFGR